MKAVIILFQKEMKACNSQPAVELRPAPPATPPVRQAGRPGAQGHALVFAVALLGPLGLGAGPRAALTGLCHPGQSCLPAGEAWTSWKSVLPGSSLPLWSPPPAPNSHRKPSGICTPRQTPAQGRGQGHSGWGPAVAPVLSDSGGTPALGSSYCLLGFDGSCWPQPFLAIPHDTGRLSDAILQKGSTSVRVGS